MNEALDLENALKSDSDAVQMALRAFDMESSIQPTDSDKQE